MPALPDAPGHSDTAATASSLGVRLDEVDAALAQMRSNAAPQPDPDADAAADLDRMIEAAIPDYHRRVAAMHDRLDAILQGG